MIKWILKLWSYKEVVGIALVLLGLALGAVYLKGRSDASSSIQTKQAEQTIKDIRKARKIENEVNKLSHTDVDKHLDKWMRD